MHDVARCTRGIPMFRSDNAIQCTLHAPIMMSAHYGAICTVYVDNRLNTYEYEYDCHHRRAYVRRQCFKIYCVYCEYTTNRFAYYVHLFWVDFAIDCTDDKCLVRWFYDALAKWPRWYNIELLHSACIRWTAAGTEDRAKCSLFEIYRAHCARKSSSLARL